MKKSLPCSPADTCMLQCSKSARRTRPTWWEGRMSRYEDQSASALWPDAAPRSMNGASEKASVRKLRNHSLRYALNNELHARPFVPLRSPERIAHLAIPRDEHGVADDHAVLVALCERYGVTAPQPG